MIQLGRQGVLAVASLLIMVGAVVSAAPASAATATGSTITTSPVAANLSVTPGSSVSTQLQLQNNGSKAVTIQVQLEKFKAADENGQAQIYQPSPDDESLSWVHFSQTSFLALPGVWNAVTMTINVPKTAAFGYYYAVIFSPTGSNASIPGNTFKGANAVLVLLNARATGEVNQLQIASFTSDRRVYQYLPATLSVKVHNSGDVFTAPRGDIYISRTPNGPVIDTLPINSGAGNVLPGTNRIFQIIWDDGFPVYQSKRINDQIVSDKNGKPIMELNWDLTHLAKFRFGRYYARLVMVYNDGSRDIPLQAQVSFWVIPWLLIGLALVIVIVLALGVFTIVRFMLRGQRHHIRLR